MPRGPRQPPCEARPGPAHGWRSPPTVGCHPDEASGISLAADGGFGWLLTPRIGVRAGAYLAGPAAAKTDGLRALAVATGQVTVQGDAGGFLRAGRMLVVYSFYRQERGVVTFGHIEGEIGARAWHVRLVGFEFCLAWPGPPADPRGRW